MYCKINWFDTLDSTQEEVRRHISELDNLSVTAALYQTSGKGQRGNRWNSEKSRNLMFSILLRPGLGGVPEVPAPGQFFISLVASLAVHATLQDYGISSKIKWPNDIYAGNKKICGMLIENTLGPKG
ncbi:MAG: biotin--[Bacteroidales bacterium]|nr:biotin--[acetyl-CoA-carboxylase] ligase [Bacteroidales bacterium]